MVESFGFSPVTQEHSNIEVDEDLVMLQELLNVVPFGLHIVSELDDFRFSLLVAARHFGLIDVEHPVVEELFDLRYGHPGEGTYSSYIARMTQSWGWAVRTLDQALSKAVVFDPGLRQVLVLEQVMKDDHRMRLGLLPEANFGLTVDDVTNLRSELATQLKIGFGSSFPSEVAEWAHEESPAERAFSMVGSLLATPMRLANFLARTPARLLASEVEEFDDEEDVEPIGLPELTLASQCIISDEQGMPHAVRVRDCSAARIGFITPDSPAVAA